MSTENPTGNHEQLEYWSGPPGERWAAQQEALDRVLAPLGHAAIDAARVVEGERALDVGCGCGDTTLSLAERVGPRGHVFGIDISRPMLARALARLDARALGFAPIELREADAAVAELPAVDLLFSRFGVMFFADPLAAFSHLKKSARSRLAFVCWRSAAENEWARVPLQAVAPHLAPDPPPDPFAPGPFAFADRARVHAILTSAGFRDVQIEPLDARLSWSQSPELAIGVRFIATIGPAARRLNEAEPAARARAELALADALASHQTATGLVLSAAAWIVTAQ